MFKYLTNRLIVSDEAHSFYSKQIIRHDKCSNKPRIVVDDFQLGFWMYVVWERKIRSPYFLQIRISIEWKIYTPETVRWCTFRYSINVAANANGIYRPVKKKDVTTYNELQQKHWWNGEHASKRYEMPCAASAIYASRFAFQYDIF